MEKILGEEGNFEIDLIQHPRYVDMDTCIACGLCAEKCPKKVLNEYDAGLGKRKAIYVKYAQAVPLKYAIDAENCIFFKKGKCKNCEKVCPAGSINFEEKERKISIKVGAVVMSLGCEVFDPLKYDVYGYKQSPNIITSLEFERILSSTGPFEGHLVRPSDKKEPKKIAWIQCVGSRDIHEGAHEYCSAVCCTYAIKESIVAKEHAKESLDAAIFFIDIRTHGKDFERYYNRAKAGGVRFIKSRITNIPTIDDTGDLAIHYIDESGKKLEETFDLVVLSVGLTAPRGMLELAEKFGIDLDSSNYAISGSFKPVQTSRPGIFVCGAFQGPKDIPQSVIESSACAAMVEGILAESRGTLTRSKERPQERDVRGETPRVGVFICNCGSNIAGVVDTAATAEYAKNLSHVVYVEENLFSCSQDSQDKMAQIIKEQNLNRVVVSACSPRTHEELFQETVGNAGINKYLFEMANVRNQCSWVHSNNPKEATKKAQDQVRMAVAKVSLAEPLVEPEIDINQNAMVIGGGISGLTAAKNLAEQGYHTYLIEKADTLGGQARNLYETWKGENVRENMAFLIEEVQSCKNIEVLLNTELINVEGFVGNFKSTIKTDGEEKVLENGVAIIASGGSELKPDQYLYGKDSRVITSLELDRKFIDNDQSLKKVDTAVFIQCVGSRIEERPYCSKICCTHSIASAIKLKEINPEMDIFIVYRDMRSYGLRENLYRQARDKGINFIRYEFDKELKVDKDQNDLNVLFTDYVLQQKIEICPDLLILATAVIAPEKNTLPQLFKVPLNDDGFFVEAHVKLRPIDFSTDGVFVCGIAHSPKPLDESIAQGLGAAARAVTLLSKKRMFTNALVAKINQESCVGCMGCMNVCSYDAISFLPDLKVCQVNEALCKGCGACAATCTSGSVQLMGFTEKQLYAQIEKAVSF